MQEFERLDWGEILTRLEKMATSETGRKQLRELIPLPSPELATQSFSEIQQARAVLAHGQRPFMESLDLFPMWHNRLQKDALLKTLELKDVRHFCMEVLALTEILRLQVQFLWVKNHFEGLMDASEPLSAIDQVMGPDGEIRSDASETLYKLHRERQNQVRSVQNILDRLVKQHEMEPVLQDRYVTNREGRWVLPIKSGMQHHFEGIIHGSSQTKQTVFMEPKEIIPLNNRLREIDVGIEEEIERILSELSKYLNSLCQAFEHSRNILADCDIRFAQAQLSIHLNASPPQFSEHDLNLIDVRHPLLILTGEKVISNPVHLDEHKRILLLSGPNAGGKTVLLKSVGLAAHMARCGLPICAEEGSKLPFFKNLHVAVGDSQSVDAHLSTFAAHLKILNESANCQGSGNLLLIDEICGSTDPEEGTALARAFIEAYAQNSVFAVITSHLGPLKLGWQNNSGVINGSLEYDAQSGRPTYQFLMGVPGQSLALKTARRVGIPAAIIDKALSYLQPETRRYQTGLDDLEQMKTELRQLKEELYNEAKETRLQKSKYQSLVEKFEREKDKMLEQALRRAERKIDALIENTKVEETFKRHSELGKIQNQLPEIIKASQKASAPSMKIDSADDFAKAFPPGTKVFASNIGRDAVIQGIPNSKGEVPVLSNSMRLMVHWENLKPPQQAMNPTMEVIRKTKDFALSPLESDRVIDVRGQNVDEALIILEQQLDTAILNQEDRVKIVHGHGTEALKRGVRAYLSRSIYVKKWQAATVESGGDGVTWAELQDE